MYKIMAAGGRNRALATGVRLVILAALLSLSAAWAEAGILFIQQDQVQEFSIVTGVGYQTGTATGKINGTSFVDFTFRLMGPPGDKTPISFSNHVVITDLDSDQIEFLNEGQGTFHFAGSSFTGYGGPLTGTYLVTRGTGKFAHWVGNQYGYRAIATNPPGEIPSDGNITKLGTVYVEISSKKEKED